VIVELDPNVRLPSYNSPEERDQLAEAAARSIVEQALKKAEEEEEEEEEEVVVEPVRKISGSEPTSKMKIGEEDDDDDDNASNISALSGASLTEEVQEDGSVVIDNPGLFPYPEDIPDRIRLCYRGKGEMKPVWFGNSKTNPGFKVRAPDGSICKFIIYH